MWALLGSTRGRPSGDWHTFDGTTIVLSWCLRTKQPQSMTRPIICAYLSSTTSEYKRTHSHSKRVAWEKR